MKCGFQDKKSGREEQYLTIQLEDATVVGIRTEQLNDKYPENNAHDNVPKDSFSLNFAKIEIYPETANSEHLCAGDNSVPDAYYC